MLVGIVGRIGAGKSTAAEIFEKYGAYVISADKIGRDVVEKNPSVLKQLAKTFGTDILTPAGKLRRRKLGEIAFASDDTKRKLNAIVHPALLKELDRQVKAAQKTHTLVVIDAALLIDWGWQKKVDLTVLIHAGVETQTKRLRAKGYDLAEVRQRLRSQLPYRTLRKQADVAVLNNTTRAKLETKIRRLISRLAKTV
ncbi:MAG: dephospho-CoA kinase [candidate division Zixibacteria bacterium]|nr:dephospho-CoA kinase [candidate division Zixibacteria bacterium]